MPFVWDNLANADDEAFDSETDADGDLNASAAAVHSGTNGYAVTYDDANVAVGRLDAAAIDQTQGTIECWFDPNSVAFTGSFMVLVLVYDGAGAASWQLSIEKPSTYTATVYIRNDGGGQDTIGPVALSDAYQKLRMVFRRSSGAGNNDGATFLYVNDVLLASKTNSDNDTRDWDACRFGMNNTDQASGWAGTFYFDDCQIANEILHSYLASGSLTFSGDGRAALSTKVILTGALTFVGGIAKTIYKILAGAITFIGTLAKVKIAQWIVRMKGSPAATVLMDESPDLEIEMDETPSFGVKLDNA